LKKKGKDCSERGTEQATTHNMRLKQLGFSGRFRGYGFGANLVQGDRFELRTSPTASTAIVSVQCKKRTLTRFPMIKMKQQFIFLNG
jgi:hypothetical protein